VRKLPRKVSEYVRQNVYITPGGLFSRRYLSWAIEVIGAGRILVSTDYPFELPSNSAARSFVEHSKLSDEDRSKIASSKWERMCADNHR